jgi:hypothetical protein
MSVRPEDVSLAEELSTKGGVTAMARFPDLQPVEQWVKVILALREHGYVIRKADDTSDGPDFTAAYRRCEPRIREVLKRLAPPGTTVTPHLVAKVQQEVVRVIAAELRASGVPAAVADTLAGLMSAAMSVKAKQT